MLHLQNKLLIASPIIEEGSLFHRSLVYVDRHSSEGTRGYIVNKPSDVKVGEILSSAGVEKKTVPARTAHQPVYIGGPVNSSSVTVLCEDPDASSENDLLGGAQVPLVSTSETTLKSIGAGDGPKRYIMLLGCSSWDPGQLEKEFRDDAWIAVTCMPEVMFDPRIDDRLLAAATSAGFDFNMLVANRGI